MFLLAIGASPTVAMEMGNEKIEIDMVDHVARLAPEITN